MKMEEINITVGGTSNTRKYRVTPMKFKELKTKLLTEFANVINREFHDECVVNVRENNGTVNVSINLTKSFFDRYNASLKKGQKPVTLTEGVIRFEMSKDEIHFELNSHSVSIREMIVNSVTFIKETFVPQWEELLNSYEVVDEDKHEDAKTEEKEVDHHAIVKAIRKISFVNKCKAEIADAFGISEKSISIFEDEEGLDLLIMIGKDFVDGYNKLVPSCRKVKSEDILSNIDGILGKDFDEVFDIGWVDEADLNVIRFVDHIKEIYDDVCIPLGEEWREEFGDEEDGDKDKHETETKEVNDHAKIKAIQKASFINKCEGKIADAFGISEKSVSILESEEGLDLYIMIGEDFVNGYNKLVPSRKKVKSEDILSSIGGIIGKDFDEVFDTGWIDEDDRNIIKFVDYIKEIYENVCVPLGEEWQEKFGDDEEDDDDED